jgi:hypothetical protein
MIIHKSSLNIKYYDLAYRNLSLLVNVRILEVKIWFNTYLDFELYILRIIILF